MVIKSPKQQSLLPYNLYKSLTIMGKWMEEFCQFVGIIIKAGTFKLILGANKLPKPIQITNGTESFRH